MSNCLEVQDIDDVKDYAETIVNPISTSSLTWVDL